MSDNREKIVARIQALRSKGADTTSENEAMQCMAMAARLQEAYRIAEVDLAIEEGKEVTFDIRTNHPVEGGWNGNRRSVVQRILHHLTALNETKCCLRTYDRTILVTGDWKDIEAMTWQIDMIRTVFDREYAAWKRTQQSVPRTAKSAFETGFAARLNDRISELIADRENDREEIKREAAALLEARDIDIAAVNSGAEPAPQISQSRELVMIDAIEAKREETREAFRNANPNLRAGSGFAARGGNAYHAGSAAGGRVHLGKALTGASANKLT